MSSQKGARNKLADVLADIKNSRAEDEYDYINHDAAPTPPKRRSAVNYVALSGHVPRQSRSNNANNLNSHANSIEPKTTLTTNTLSSTLKRRTYVLRLFDRQVDLAPFAGDNGREETPLYPVCRAWVHQINRKGQEKSSLKQQIKTEKPTISQNLAQQQEQPSTDTPTEINSLPSPKPKADIIKRYKLASSKDQDIDVRIPKSVRDFKAPSDVEETIDKSIKTMNHQECMEMNKQRWKKVKRDWSEARRIHESRYEESFKILHDIFMSTHRGV